MQPVRPEAEARFYSPPGEVKIRNASIVVKLSIPDAATHCRKLVEDQQGGPDLDC